MKRRDLVRKLEQAGFRVTRSTGPHDVFGDGARKVSVPRHREIKEPLARAILRDAGLAE